LSNIDVGFYLVEKMAITTVDSGIRALQFLGLDEQRRASESDGFVVCIIRFFISFFYELPFYFPQLIFCSMLLFFSLAEFEGGSNYHRLLHARDDML